MSRGFPAIQERRNMTVESRAILGQIAQTPGERRIVSRILKDPHSLYYPVNAIGSAYQYSAGLHMLNNVLFQRE
jgi:hypothetical protein